MGVKIINLWKILLACLMSLAVNLQAEPADALALPRIAALGSDDFDEREAAYRALAADPRAEPVVQRHCDVADPEVRQRIGKLLAHYAQARAERAIRRGTLLVAAGNVDLMPDLMRTYQPYDPRHRLHGALCLVLSDLSVREKAIRGQPIIRFENLFFPDALGNSVRALLARPPVLGYHHSKIGETLTRDQSGKCVICPADARVDRERGIEECILLADSVLPKEGQGRLDSVVVVSNGDIRHNNLDRTFIICDGTVESAPRHSLLIARKGIRWKQAGTLREIAPGKPELTRDESTVHVVPPGKRSFGLVRFFEVSDVGLTLDACKVTKVIGPLAKAGVKPGDIFTHVDGVAVKDAEALRKALRRRYAILGYGAFTLTRDGRPLSVVAELGE
jgi:hypothetical protein